MDFSSISRSESALTGREKERVDDDNNKDSATVDGNGGMSNQLQLKSSRSLDKNVILRRIKQRKSYNKAKSAIEAILATTSQTTDDETNSNAQQQQQHKLLQFGDAFSAP